MDLVHIQCDLISSPAFCPRLFFFPVKSTIVPYAHATILYITFLLHKPCQLFIPILYVSFLMCCNAYQGMKNVK